MWNSTFELGLKYRQNFPELRLKSFLLRKTDIINQFYHFWLLCCSLCAGFFNVALLWLQRLFKIFAAELGLDKKAEKIIFYNFLNYCIIDILSLFFSSNSPRFFMILHLKQSQPIRRAAGWCVRNFGGFFKIKFAYFALYLLN